MTKTGHQQPPAPVDPADAVTQEHGDANYSGGGGSSGPLASAQGAYMVKNMGSSQGSVVTDTMLNFDTIVSSRGDLGGAGNQVTGLKAGRTYLLIGRARVSAGNFNSIRFYDATAAAYLGDPKVQAGSTQFLTSNVTHIFTPLVDTAIELWCSSANTTSTFDGLLSELEVIEIGAVQADVVGGLEFMDVIDVTVATDEVAFGAAGDGAFQRALDGDVDEEYFCSYYMPGDHGGSTFEWFIKPNNVSTAQQCAIDYSGATSGKITSPRLTLADQFIARDVRGEFTLFAKTGRFRVYKNTSVVSAPGGGAGEMHQSRNAGTWDDQAANIESIVIAHTDGALDYILPGAQFVLWRRTRSNLRADSAAVYERNAIEVVDPGAIATTERTTGHSTYGGSVVGISARVEDAVTAGTITCNVKVDGVIVLTAVLDSTNSTSRVVRAAVGLHEFAADKNISVEFVPSAYDNAGSVPSSVTVQVHLTNDALINPPKNTQIEGALWYPPEFAHPDDDEFDSGTLGWTFGGIAPIATPIDPYNSDTTGGPRVSLNDRRKSWFMIQPAATAGLSQIHKPFVPPTNVFVWARLFHNGRIDTQFDNDCAIGLRLPADDGGGPSGADYVSMFLNESDAGTMEISAIVREGNVNVVNVTGPDLFGTLYTPQPYEYVGIHKVGSTYHFWAATPGGVWTHFTSHTYVGAAIAHVELLFSSQSAASPGNTMYGVDFVRFLETATDAP